MRNAKIDALAALPVESVAEKIGMPLETWAGNCYAVAVALVESGLLPSGTRAVYGHWCGDIAPTSRFASRATLGFTGHGWALTPEGQILDPTRWAFEDVAPYVYVGADPTEHIEEQCRTCEHLVDEHEDLFGGRCTGGDQAGYDCGYCCFEPNISTRARAEERDYDEGGNKWAARNLRPFPAFDPAATLTPGPPPDPVRVALALHGYAATGPLTLAQAHWAANLPLSMLGPAAGALYTWLDACDLSGLVPIDNRFAVLGGSPTAA